ncbi:MAG: glycosyl transferase family 2 [Ruminococcaceae bacterium]|nr:glycosyl transferase family 2 [Oscillospiraceae bacterium]
MGGYPIYKVCVYAICKNEAKHVDRFMDSMSEADWVCVLDTGSTDDTVERLRSRGAVVEQASIAPWRFDAARNESLRLIPDDADICCCIDLDEQFHPGWRDALEAAWRPDTTRARYRYTWSFLPDGSEGHVFWADKIHKRGVYRWTRPVHEVLSYTGEGRERFVAAEGVQLDHHPDEAKSRGQYLPLLELAVAEDPEDDRSCHYLGREYMFHGEWEKAISVLTRHLSLPRATWADERAASMRYIARCRRRLGRDDLAAVWYHRAIAEAPHLREPYVDFCSLLYDHRNWAGVVYFARCALAICERPRTYITEGYAWGALPWDLLSVALWHLGQLDEGREAVRQALTYAPEDQRLLDNLAYFEQAQR